MILYPIFEATILCLIFTFMIFIKVMTIFILDYITLSLIFF
jgi:hypothetical protein